MDRCKCSKYPKETTISLTEKGREIGLKLREVEKMMKNELEDDNESNED